jgi:hypothetical protein
MRNRKYGHRERKEVDVCPSDLKEEELLDPCEGGGRVFIDERLWFSAEFAVAATAWLAHRSVYRDRDCGKATCQRSLLSPSGRVAAPPSFVDLPVLVALLCGTRGSTVEGGAPATFVHSDRPSTRPRLAFPVSLQPIPRPYVITKRRAVGHA